MGPSQKPRHALRLVVDNDPGNREMFWEMIKMVESTMFFDLLSLRRHANNLQINKPTLNFQEFIRLSLIEQWHGKLGKNKRMNKKLLDALNYLQFLVYFEYLKREGYNLELQSLVNSEELESFVGELVNSAYFKINTKGHSPDPGPQPDPGVRAAFDRIREVSNK